MSVAAWMIVLLSALAIWTAGLTGWLIFGPLTYRHLQDRDQQHGKGSWFGSPAFMHWVLTRGWADSRDQSLRGLAAPAMVLGWCMLVGGVVSVIALLTRPGQAPW